MGFRHSDISISHNPQSGLAEHEIWNEDAHWRNQRWEPSRDPSPVSRQIQRERDAMAVDLARDHTLSGVWEHLGLYGVGAEKMATKEPPHYNVLHVSKCYEGYEWWCSPTGYSAEGRTQYKGVYESGSASSLEDAKAHATTSWNRWVSAGRPRK